MAQINWLPEAVDDLKRLHAFIKPHSVTAANRAVDTLLKAVETLQAFPEKGRPWEPDINFRELSVSFGARGYAVRYRLYQNQIVIVRIWHALETGN